MKRMRSIVMTFLSIVMSVTCMTMPVSAAVTVKTATAKHSGFKYTSSNVSKITYDSKRSYVTTKASFEFVGNGRFAYTDILSHSISNGFMMKSAKGTAYYKPVAIVINGNETSLSNTSRVKYLVGDTKIYNSIMKSGYKRNLIINEAASGATYTKIKMTETKKMKQRSKRNGQVITVVYHCTKGSYTVNWRKDGRATCYNIYTNYGNSRINLKPSVGFKGVDVKFNSSVKKGDNAVLRINQ